MKKIKKVLWISRHELKPAQIILLKKMFGQKVKIIQANVRFKNLAEFIDFVFKFEKQHYIFAVIYEEWKDFMEEEYGVFIGTIHKPKKIKENGKEKKIFSIKYKLFGKIHTKSFTKVYGAKGYFRPCGRRAV